MGLRVAGTHADTGLTTTGFPPIRVEEAQCPVLGRSCELAETGIRIAPVFSALVVVFAGNRWKNALPVPSACVIGAQIIVFAQDALTKMLTAAQAVSTCERNFFEPAFLSVVRRLVLALRTADTGIEEINEVGAEIACAGVSVAAAHTGTRGLEIEVQTPEASDQSREENINTQNARQVPHEPPRVLRMHQACQMQVHAFSAAISVQAPTCCGR